MTRTTLRGFFKLLLAATLMLAVGVPVASAQGPTKIANYTVGVPFQMGFSFSFTAASTQTVSFNTSGIGWYQLVWIPTGTVSACTLTVDGSAAGAGGTFSTGSLVASQTCTSSGSFTSSSAVFGVAGKVTPTITGSGSVTVFLFGYVSAPGATITGTVTVTSSTPATILSGQQAVTASAAALASNALIKGICVEALSTNTISVYVGPSGVTTATGIELPAGSSYCPIVSNSNAIFVIASTTGASVTWSGN